MRPYLRPQPAKTPRLFIFGAEQALGSLIVLAIAYVIGFVIVGSHDAVIGELTGQNPENAWHSLQFWVLSGLFWLAGGITALIFWPIFLTHLTLRLVWALMSLR